MNKLIIALIVLVSALVVAGGFFFSPEVQADTQTTILITVPNDVFIISGQHSIVFKGGPTELQPNFCAGVPASNPHSVVVLDSEGGAKAQVTDILVKHDHAIPNGSSYLITSDPVPCGDFRVYTATLVE